jgi:hypothetical protein
MRKLCDQFVGHPVDEILLVRVARQVLQWKDGDGPDRFDGLGVPLEKQAGSGKNQGQQAHQNPHAYSEVSISGFRGRGIRGLCLSFHFGCDYTGEACGAGDSNDDCKTLLHIRILFSREPFLANPKDIKVPAPSHGQLSSNVQVYLPDLTGRGIKLGPDGLLYVAEAGTGGSTSAKGQCTQVIPPVTSTYRTSELGLQERAKSLALRFTDK